MVEALRESILGARPSIHELGYHDALGYSTSTSSVDRILYIAAFADHVALGFFFGADLQEQERLRVGQGERMRHVKVTNLADAQWAALRRLVRQAVADGPEHIKALHERRASR